MSYTQDQARLLRARLYPGGMAPYSPLSERVQVPLKLDPSGAANPTLTTLWNAVRHRIRDGVPTNDTTPVPFNMVRLESLSDQIPAAATPAQTVFQCRYADVPTQRYINAEVVPGTLVAYVDGSWAPTHPTVDVDVNGNFTLPIPPVNQLLITYAWQYLSDGEIYQFIDEARQWLRAFNNVTAVPDGLVPALVSYAASRALWALSRSATLAPVRAGDSDIDWSALGKNYQTAALAQEQLAQREWTTFYTQGPAALDPTAIDVSAVGIPPYTPLF